MEEKKEGTRINLNLGNIPLELQALPQWVVRREKLPINPKTGTGAKAGDPSTWGTFEQAVEALPYYDGLGFEFHSNGIVGVDLDHVLEGGTLREDARRIVDALDSYTERSPSGTGLHILAYGTLPSKGRKHTVRGTEMYQAARYFTVTGDLFEGRKTLQRRERELDALYGELFPPEVPRPSRPPLPALPPRLTCDLLSVGLEKDPKLKEYWEGRRDSSDESGNDLAFMSKLAYWCDGDVDRMIAAFARSPYAAQKDGKHQKKLERADYLRRTADRAARGCERTASQDNAEYAAKKAQRPPRDVQTAPRDVQPVEGTKGFLNPIATEQARARYTLDDIGAARLFADTFRDVLRYVPEFRRWCVYTGGVWQPDDDDVKASALAKRLADYMGAIVPPAPPPTSGVDEWKDARAHYRKYRAMKWRKTILQDSHDELPASANDFDLDPLLFNCKNGTLDLRTLCLAPHDPAAFLSKQASVTYLPEARCERFERFISEITEGDRGRARMLQRALGYALKGEANEECYFNAVGEKTRNGKGTLFDTVLQIFGSYGAQMDFSTIARAKARDGSRPTPDLARLRGVRLVLANEPDKGIFVNEAMLKQITGNDDVTARMLHAAPIQFKPVFKLFITANSRPRVTDGSLFASDRVKMLPFPHHFTAAERDSTLKAQLRTEEAKSGILNWLLDGYALYCKEGLRDTEEMVQLVEEYRRENDYVGQYIDEQLVFNKGGPSGRTPVKAVRKDYERWCVDMGIKALGFQSFREDLVRRGITVTPYRNMVYIDAKYRRSDDFYTLP